MTDVNKIARGTDSGTWQELYAASAVLSEDQSIIRGNLPPRMIEVLGTAGTLKLRRYDGTFVTFTAGMIGVQRRILASCYNLIDSAGTSSTGILVTW
jgi:hypothetical protein